jgi:hypothetical protein
VQNEILKIMVLEGSDGASIWKKHFDIYLYQKKSSPKATGQFQSNLMQIIFV